MKKLIITLTFIIISLISLSQSKPMLIDWQGEIDTIPLYYKADTINIEIVYIDSLSYLRFAPGVCIRSGYGNDIFFPRFYERDYKETFFVLYKQKYFEISPELIYNITWPE